MKIDIHHNAEAKARCSGDGNSRVRSLVVGYCDEAAVIGEAALTERRRYWLEQVKAVKDGRMTRVAHAAERGLKLEEFVQLEVAVNQIRDCETYVWVGDFMAVCAESVVTADGVLCVFLEWCAGGMELAVVEMRAGSDPAAGEPAAVVRPDHGLDRCSCYSKLKWRVVVANSCIRMTSILSNRL